MKKGRERKEKTSCSTRRSEILPFEEVISFNSCDTFGTLVNVAEQWCISCASFSNFELK